MDNHGHQNLSGSTLHQVHSNQHLTQQQHHNLLLQQQQNHLYNNNNNHNHLNSQHIVHAGWLMKSPPEKRIWKHLGKWRRRWFVLKLSGQIPGQYVLEYFVDQSCKKLKGVIDLDQCEQVDAGLQLEIRKTAENFDFMFDLRTSKRVYYLVACTEEEMNKWVECICSVCGLKIEATTLSPSELSPLLAAAQMGVGSHSPNNGTEQLTTSNTSTEERYSPQPSVSGDSLGPTMMAPTPPPPQTISVPSTVALPPLQQPSPPPSNQKTKQQSSPLSRSKTPPNVLQVNQENLNDALLNYIPISECYTGAKPNSNHSPPPPRPPKPRALQPAGKSQSSLALWPPAEVAPQNGANNSRNSPVNSNLPTQAQLPPPQPLKAMMMANSIANDTRRSSPLQYSKSLQVNNSGPPVFINDRPMAFSYNSGTLPPSHSHNYEFCNANVVMNANGTFEVPPLVNRNLKPQRRSSGRTGSIDSSPFGSQSARHTLPRPPPSYPIRGEDGRKSFNHNHNSQNHPHSNTLSFSHLGLEKNKKLPYNSSVNHHQPSHHNHHHHPNHHQDHLENSEIQYLDLDLESTSESTNSQSPREGSSSATTSGVGSSSHGTSSDSSLASSGHSNIVTNNLYNGNIGHNNQLTTWNIPPSSNSANHDPFTNTSGSSLHSHQLPNHYGNSNIQNNNNNANVPNANLVSGSGKADNPSTVYKQVDFVKTKAFNKMRVDMDRNGFNYRNGTNNANN